MTKDTAKPTQALTLALYLAWVDAWLLTSPMDSKADGATLSLEDQARLFIQEASSPLPDTTVLKGVASSFRHSLQNNQVLLGGKDAPSCAETNLLSEDYNPAAVCSCAGKDLYPLPDDADIDSIRQKSNCTAVHNTLQALEAVLDRQNEWNPDSLYTPTRLREAVTEILLANSKVQPAPSTCSGSQFDMAIPPVQAPDRRPNSNDTREIIHAQMYPMAEKVKFCLDAKYYFVLAAVASNSLQDGLVRAIADSGNDVLIGDYCEVADGSQLKTLQQTGAAAVSFLKLCALSGALSQWAFDNLMASVLHFRVLGYYRDHARDVLADGVYGSRMTGLVVHRYIDLCLYPAIAAAHLTTGDTITEAQAVLLSEACALINDLVDFRSDTVRKQRENIVLRGVRGNICVYLDEILGCCLSKAAAAIRSSRTTALVVLAFCNWAVLSSHHKVFELSTQVSEVPGSAPCEDHCVGDGKKYGDLLDALTPFGTLGKDAPSALQTRAELDAKYGICRMSAEHHLAWLADITRSLLHPENLRKIVDVVHFEWTGGVGDVNYCP